MIRIDEIWLATEPLDMRAGPDTALARVVQVFGSARPHCAYLFANKRGNRMKVLIHDGFGIWLCARRLNRGKFCNHKLVTQTIIRMAHRLGGHGLAYCSVCHNVPILTNSLPINSVPWQRS